MKFTNPFRGRLVVVLLPVMSAFLLSCGGGGGNTSLTTGNNSTGPATNNSVQITASFGPNGQSGGPLGPVLNVLTTTVTVCKPGTLTCAAIDNVIVDTGSIGLRLVPSAVSSVGLSPITSSAGNALEECIQYGDTSVSWGPIELADVHLGGEVASNIAVQVIGPGGTPAVPASCISQPVDPSFPNGGNLNTLQELDANGILGIGNGGVDCGSFCTQSLSGNPYYVCPNGACTQTMVAASFQVQATNPVAAFSSSDRNGVVISLPPVGSTGAGSVSGTLTFGINTQADNTMGSVTLYAMDQCGDLPTVTFNNVAFNDTFCTTGTGTSFGGFFDTGTGALNISDQATLAAVPSPIIECPSTTNGFGFYCLTGGGSTTLPNIGLTGASGVGSGSISLNIFDGTALVNTHNAVFNDIGTDSVTGGTPATDFFDFGMPFFLGRTAYLSIGGVTVPNTSNPSSGFVAF
jgi:hypothetical protein